jgi:hypothetical protein
MKSIASKFQKRLLNSSKREDYFFAFIIPLIPIILSVMLGIWKHTDGIPGCIEQDSKCSLTGYEDAINHMSIIVSLPLSIFLLRKMSDKLFGVNIKVSERNTVPILDFFSNDKDIQDKIHQKLRITALNPKITYVSLILDVTFHLFDNWKCINQYILTYLGYPVEPEEIYWANLYLVEPNKISITKNLVFSIFAYLGQFSIFVVGITVISLFLLYNIFYLNLIYQRRRDKENTLNKIVLNFNDQNNRFGLKKLNRSFNLQLFVLLFAGVALLASRLRLATSENLYPYFGQYAIVILWLLGFFIVLMPTFLKFLPLFSKKILYDGWSIDTYLKEFIPPSQDAQYNPYSREVVNALASKFAWNAFWPSGDDPARALFFFVFFICLVILFPINLTSTIIFVVIALFLSETFLNLFRWTLGHVDERLVKRKDDIKPGDIIMGDIIKDIGAGAIIVNRSTVEKSFNKVREEFDEETANALKKVEEEINKSGNKEAAELFETFNEELQKPEPKKSILRTVWNGIQLALPTITQLTKVVADISKLFM